MTQTIDLATKNANKFAVMHLAYDGDPVGTVKIRLFPESAPNTVENFVTLAAQGFYDGTVFHRVIKDFMIQGGDPSGTGTGGPGYSIPAEFNERRHVTGTVAMARGEDPDSAGSQFYICLAPQPHLNRQYTVFGQVCEGMHTILALGDEPVDENNRPVHELSVQKIEIVTEQP